MQRTILYAVLNWGLGHATRSIPIIQYLIDKGNHVIIASDGDALLLLQKEFPTLVFEEVSAYNVVYANNSTQFNVTLAKQIPKFIKAIQAEQKECIALCERYNIDVIISDNRYGFYHNKIPSAFICHQLHLLYEANILFEKIVNKSYQAYLKKFTQIWVPDFEDPNKISGKLSQLKWNNIKFIGADSRFIKIDLPITHKVLVVLSGPEPQRTILEDKILEQLPEIEGMHLLIRGTKKAKKLAKINNIEIIDFATSELLNQKIESSKIVVCRSGYTSVIDLLKLNKKALLIPTPGQVEQEYLAKNLTKKNWFVIANQDYLNLAENILKLDQTKFPTLNFKYNFELIEQFLPSPIY